MTSGAALDAFIREHEYCGELDTGLVWMTSIARKTRGEFFRQLRTFVTHDAKQILSLKRGGNYAAALIIAIASEALSRLQGLEKKAILASRHTLWTR
jgi:hypothetical protein